MRRQHLLLLLLLAAPPAAAAPPPGSCPRKDTVPACFGAGDEMPCPHLPGGSRKRCIIKDVANISSCCALCSDLPGCNVFTLRGPTCHLRTSWQKSNPAQGPCTTSVLSGPLPHIAPQATAVTIHVDATNVTGRYDISIIEIAIIYEIDELKYDKK